MKMSYNKLWKLLIDKEMMKKDLRAMTGVSTTTMSRLSKDENVSLYEQYIAPYKNIEFIITMKVLKRYE